KASTTRSSAWWRPWATGSRRCTAAPSAPCSCRPTWPPANGAGSTGRAPSRLDNRRPMQVFRGFQHPGIAPACALTIGNFDGVHRGHQAMLALLRSEAQHRGLPSCVMTFEPHPRDYFAAVTGKPELAPARIATLRDQLAEPE